MSCLPLAAQQTLLASGPPAIHFYPEPLTTLPALPVAEPSTLPEPSLSPLAMQAVAGFSPSVNLYEAVLPQPEIACAGLHRAIGMPDYAFDHSQFTSAAMRAAFSHDNLVVMARNFIPGKPLPNEPGYHPLTVKEKFKAYLENTYSAGMAVSIMSDSLISQATGAYPRVNPGWQGFGERVGISAGGAEIAAFIGGFAYPTLFHQDPRYFPSHQHGIFNRMAYAASRAVIGRSDNGMAVINTSVIASHFTEAAISNFYVPYSNESVSGTIANALTGIVGVAEGHIIDEFWPDITEFVWRRTHSKLIREGMALGDPTASPVYHESSN
jgi:hypothetical protein